MTWLRYLQGRYGRDWRRLHQPVEPSARRATLRRFLCYVEVEVFSYCNRRCDFCPNAPIDRISENRFMPETAYLNLLRQLADYGFTGKLAFSRYNEPLADRIILTRLAQARATIPNVQLHTNTNGDYLNREYLIELRAAGLDSISVQDYSQGGHHLDLQQAAEALVTKAEALGCPKRQWRFQINPGELTLLAKLGGFHLEIRTRNFSQLGNSRGHLVGDVSETQRRAPCFEPHNGLYIDYNGSVMPCCNLRSDAEEHHSSILGNIMESSLEDIYFDAAATRLRHAVGNAGGNSLPVCAGCNFRNYLVAPSTLESGRIVPYYSIPTIVGYLRDRIGERFAKLGEPSQ